MRRSQRIQRQQTLHQINPPAILQANVRVDKQNSITNFGTLWGSMASLTSLSGLFRQYIIRAHAASQKAEGILTGSKWRVACGKGVCCLASSLSWSWTGSCGTQMIQYWSNVSWQSQLETRSSILDAFKNGESSFEARVSSFEFRVLSFEFRDAQRIFQESDLYLEFVTIEINNTTCHAASFICARVHVFHINVQIVSLELKSWITII